MAVVVQDGVAAELHGLRRVKATRFERRVAGRHDGLKDDIFGRCGVLNFWRVNSTRQKIDTIFFDLERDEETRKRRACTILPNGLTTEGTSKSAAQGAAGLRGLRKAGAAKVSVAKPSRHGGPRMHQTDISG